MGSPALRRTLAPAKPSAPKPIKVTKDNLGIDRGSAEWKALRALQELRNASRATPLSAEQLDVRADVDQVVEVSKRGRFSKWSFQDKLALVVKLTTIQAGGGYVCRAATSSRGGGGERLFIPGYRAGEKLGFLNGKVVPLATAGDTELDWLFDHEGGLGGGEIKSDRLDLKDTPGEISSIITDYCTEGMQDAYNSPTGMHYRLAFPFAPKTAALVQRAVDDAKTFPWPATMDLVFGDSAPIKIK